MGAKQKVIVLVEDGQVVGVQALPPAGPRVGQPDVVANLASGPRQTRHELLIEVPAAFKNDAARQRFHASLLAQVKGLGKGKG